MNALDELTGSQDVVDRSYVERRVDDWRRRVQILYGKLAEWLPDGWSSASAGGVAMHEDLMERFDVPPADLPVLALARGGSVVGRLEPRGLWIIGSNGRVDLTLPDRHFLFVDRSESFEDADWRVAPIDARRDERSLSRDVVRDILA